MYAKLFASMFEGSLRGQADEILVFVNMLATCDKDGTCDRHPRAISDETGLTVDRVIAALKSLEKPDPQSRTPDEGGRRILLLDEHRDWGWSIVNYQKYRDLRNIDERRKANREAQRRRRIKLKAEAVKGDGHQMSSPSAHTEASASGSTESTTPPVPPPTKKASRKKAARKKPKTPWPEGWVFGDPEWKAAERHSCPSRKVAEATFEDFEASARSHDYRYVIWGSAWNKWCIGREQRKYDRGWPEPNGSGQVLSQAQQRTARNAAVVERARAKEERDAE